MGYSTSNCGSSRPLCFPHSTTSIRWDY